MDTSCEKQADPAIAEQLNELLGRFTAWTETQESDEETSDLDARELSYQQALLRSRTQRSGQPDAQPVQQNAEAAADNAGIEAQSDLNPDPHCKAKPGAARQAHAAHKTPEFQQVLHGALSSSTRVAVNSGKSVWLTLRVTAAEQALIQARAAEAKLSVSAYLRQCAFEVEARRQQMQGALLEAQTAGQSSGPSAPPEPVPAPGKVQPGKGRGSKFTDRVTRLFGCVPRFTARA
jgi:Mobilization protein NikA